MIRNSEAGYAVDAESGIYHARYAEHAAQLPKTRTKKGVESFGSDFRPCRECFPPNKPAATSSKRPQPKRRRGGPVRPGAGYIVGESGPEIVKITKRGPEPR